MGELSNQDAYRKVSTSDIALPIYSSQVKKTDSFAAGIATMVTVSNKTPVESAASKSDWSKRREFTRYPGWVFLVVVLGPCLLFWATLISFVCVWL